MQNNPHEEQKRLISAFLLAILSLFLLKYILGDNKTKQQIEINKQEEVKIKETKKTYPRKDVVLENEKILGSINLRGIRLDNISLKKYKKTEDKKSDIVALFKPEEEKEGNESYYNYAEIGFLSDNKNLKLPDKSTLWKIEKMNNTQNFTLTWNNGQGITFKRNYKLDNHYMFEITDTIINKSGKEISVIPYGLIKDKNLYNAGVRSIHTGGIGYINDDLFEESYRDIKDETFTISTDKGWFGFTSQYFQSTFAFSDKPKTEIRFTAKKEEENKYSYQTDYKMNEINIANNETKEISLNFFAGAKEKTLLEHYQKNYNIERFELSIDYGLWYFLTKPFTWILIQLNKLFSNFGLAILGLTILIRLLLYPVANKSFKAMQKMKKLQPEMKRLQKIYASDKMRLNQEIAALYKKHKVSPMSGCLPLLLQIPVFFSLYKSLLISIEMRHAEFFGWITDLSAADPTNMWNLFGLLPYTPPSFLPAIGALPALMALTMYMQQKLSPQTPDANSNHLKIIKWMPFIFIFILYKLPSGLILYWTASNLFSIMQQKIIMKKIDKTK